ncbi:hypothetical protein PHYBLDRAFT_71509 [Phycomyces blakesleeanus NRRL 1555(-)]|uniref:Uncharacterized protein n=1 Tax=Phycomyces blakesleeanus (strain ATCC 8743b / DSM 1359 / FGSC 10004 / NBRC 33097 / NRRL 1555) TaxID=763407 RepID=A0A167LBI9_PHYB8|nr:hypothetical protein PHYBLDRAFT_71509 [Phycomyces blakesleeanus NRRL 1555(-)]OAD70065.1 hypothetical protein PHYBLDRAFT_71509 [Phycomyces blakesleeanus NRRL 1555(-)]|eukprot:XP_018288105.1 hypothetical protein PHYBLDRAFT_71509 [Phycomyces blakesleeanus NRRL 1555(-)]
MSSTSNTHNKKYFCNECKNNQEGYSLAQRRTAQCYNKRARYEAFKRNTSAQSSSMEVDVEMHRFIATFVVMFTSRYVVNKGAIVLIKFINKLLTIYEQDFQLPLSLPGLQCMTGFSAMNKNVQRFLVCQDCHKVYEKSALAPSHCDFMKLGAHSACNCQLTKKSSSGLQVAKREYCYQSVKNALRLLFLRPDFKQKIRQWNKQLKIINTLCNVYDGDMWKELEEKDGESFVEDPHLLMITLNIDWFQPFDGASYSCGAMYLVVNNLP